MPCPTPGTLSGITRLAALSLALVWLSGCAGVLTQARRDHYAGRGQAALESLEAAGPPARQELLFLMEKGVIEFDLGRHADSIRTLRQAGDWLDAHIEVSVSEQAAAILTTDLVTAYNGEYFERVWVHNYLAMNYLLTGEYESALVEAKKALAALDREPEALARDAFTHALAGLCFEVLGEDNGAFIEYKLAARALGENSQLAPELFHLARVLGFFKEAEAYEAQISGPLKQRLGERGLGQCLVFVARGRGPVKEAKELAIPPYARIAWAAYRSRDVAAGDITVSEGGKRLPATCVSSDVFVLATASLKAREKTVVAREAARAAAREAVAQSVENNLGEMAALLARTALFLSGEADTRSWETLPASLSLLRIPLEPGEYHLSLEAVDGFGALLSKGVLQPVVIKPGRMSFVSIRLP